MLNSLQTGHMMMVLPQGMPVPRADAHLETAEEAQIFVEPSDSYQGQAPRRAEHQPQNAQPSVLTPGEALVSMHQVMGEKLAELARLLPARLGATS